MAEQVMPVQNYALLNNLYHEFSMRKSLRRSLSWGLGIVALGMLSGGAWAAAPSCKVTQIIGNSPDSWEKAANAAIASAAPVPDQTVKVDQLDVVVVNGVVTGYRAKVEVCVPK